MLAGSRPSRQGWCGKGWDHLEQNVEHQDELRSPATPAELSLREVEARAREQNITDLQEGIKKTGIPAIWSTGARPNRAVICKVWLFGQSRAAPARRTLDDKP